MLFMIGFFLLFHDPSIADDEYCVRVEYLHKHPRAPSMSLKILEFPDEDVLPIGYSITIVCTSNLSKEDNGRHKNAQPYYMQYYYNKDYDDYLKTCCCDREDSKVCTFFIQNASESHSGIYDCVSENLLECTIDTLTLSFKEPSSPRFKVDLPRQLNVSDGSKANLSCHASGIPRPFITWFKDGRRVSSSYAWGVKGYSMLIFESVHLNDQGGYWCEANNTEGWNRSTSVNVTVLWKPVFSIHPKSTSAYLDAGVTTVTLFCEARGYPRPVISWLKNNSSVTNNTVIQNGSISTLVVVFTNITEQPHKYRCVANNSLGSTLSREARLTISKRPPPDIIEPVFYLHPKSTLASRDDTVEFTCAARGFPRPSITWLKDGMAFSDTSAKVFQRNLSDSSELKIVSVSDRHVGYYACLATASNTQASSRDAILSLKDETVTGERLSKAVWFTIGTIIGVVFLIVVIVLIVFKQKRARGRRNYHISKEMVKAQQELIQLQIESGKDSISQLRNVQSTVSDNTEDGAKSMADEDEVIDNETYLKGMAVDRNWEIPRDRLTITEHKLGGGEFGIVNKGMYLRTDGNELPVAVKILKDNSDQQQRLALIRELETLIHVGRHQNIVSLVGACTFEEPLCVVIEFVSGGSLDNLLRISRVQIQDPTYANIWSRLTERELLRIASDITSGMRHLESKRCIHRDLACRNVLVGTGLIAKVADFGMARDISTEGQYIKTTEGRIPWLWMSMEALRGTNTSKGDVWSFGVVLWEIVTLGELPYRGVTGVIELHDLLQDGARLQKPPHCSDELYDIMLRCWQKSPDDRPSFQELHVILQEILAEKGRTYINVTFVEDQEMEDYEETIL